LSSGALLALGAGLKAPLVALIGIVPLAFFMYMEMLYMYIQAQVLARSTLVEELLDSAARSPTHALDKEYRFGLHQVFEGKFSVRGVLMQLSGRPHIYAFYIGLMLAMGSEALLIWLVV
jgi:hypothetical protein